MDEHLLKNELKKNIEKSDRKLLIFSKDAVIYEVIASAISLAAVFSQSFDLQAISDKDSSKETGTQPVPFAVFVDLDSFSQAEAAAILDSYTPKCKAIAIGKEEKSPILKGDVIFLRRPIDLKKLTELFKPSEQTQTSTNTQADKNAPKEARRASERTTEPQTFPSSSELVYAEASGKFFYGKNELSLTSTERELLSALYKKRGNVLSREELASIVWKGNVASNVIDVYINYLRSKLDHRFNVRLIVSVRNKGYTLLDR